MKTSISKVSDLGARVFAFGAAHEDLFPPGSAAWKGFAAVRDALTEMKGSAAAEVSPASFIRKRTNAKAASQTALLNDLQMLARAARVVAITTPGVELPFDFFSKLHSDIRDLEHGMAGGTRERMRPPAAFDAAMEKMMKAMQRLDAIVPKILQTLQHNSSLFASWDAARRPPFSQEGRAKISQETRKAS